MSEYQFVFKSCAHRKRDVFRVIKSEKSKKGIEKFNETIINENDVEKKFELTLPVAFVEEIELRSKLICCLKNCSCKSRINN